MTSKDWIATALRALAEHDRALEAPEEVGTRVLAGFRQRQSRRTRKGIVLAGLAVAAAITLLLARPQERPKAVAPSPVRHEPVAVIAAPAPMQKPLPKARPVTRQPREVVTEFFPLLDVALPFERGELLRVTVPASTMRRVGLPVNQDRVGDRVYADVLVGEEGLARAIRFVSYEQ